MCYIPKRRQAVYAIHTVESPVLQHSLFKSDCPWGASSYLKEKRRAGKKRSVCPDECNLDVTDDGAELGFSLLLVEEGKDVNQNRSCLLRAYGFQVLNSF